MDRIGWMVLSILGFVGAISFLGGIIATYGTSATAPEWTQSIMTVFAIIVAIVVPWITEGRHQEMRHRAAEVIVASTLRSWLRVAAQQIMENQQFRGTGGSDGKRVIEMPMIAASLDQIAAMRPHYARQVLTLLERHARRQNSIDSENYYGDETESLMEYYKHIAHLFWSARRIYTEIAAERELDEFTNRTTEIEAVKHAAAEAEKFEELRNNAI